MEYFDNFPTISYANSICIDITRRPGILNTVVKNPYAFAPYELKDGERADRIADLYYGDASREWIVWLSTGTIDPYGQWLQTQDSLESYIIDTYGTIEQAQILTHHYTLNWGMTDVSISPTTFSAMTNDVQALYQPRYDDTMYGNIVDYSIRKEDFRYSTNLIMKLTVDNNIFTVGDYITFANGGHAEVCWSNGSNISIQHITNYDSIVSNTTLTQYSFGIQANVVAVSYVSNNIPLDLRSYFIPVSFYDYEVERNEALRSVQLIDKKFTSQIEKELTNILR